MIDPTEMAHAHAAFLAIAKQARQDPDLDVHMMLVLAAISIAAHVGCSAETADEVMAHVREMVNEVLGLHAGAAKARN